VSNVCASFLYTATIGLCGSETVSAVDAAPPPTPPPPPPSAMAGTMRHKCLHRKVNFNFFTLSNTFTLSAPPPSLLPLPLPLPPPFELLFPVSTEDKTLLYSDSSRARLADARTCAAAWQCDELNTYDES
jgi:hypothetical protein